MLGVAHGTPKKYRRVKNEKWKVKSDKLKMEKWGMDISAGSRFAWSVNTDAMQEVESGEHSYLSVFHSHFSTLNDWIERKQIGF